MLQLGGSRSPSTAQVASAMRDCYETIRAAKVREMILLPHLGPDFMRAERLGTLLPKYLQEQPGLYNQLVGGMNGFNLGGDIIVAGAGDADGAKLAAIGHPGTIVWLDKLGYAAIGSGGSHAIMRLALGGQTRNSALAESVYRVFPSRAGRW